MEGRLWKRSCAISSAHDAFPFFFFFRKSVVFLSLGFSTNNVFVRKCARSKDHGCAGFISCICTCLEGRDKIGINYFADEWNCGKSKIILDLII